MSYPHPRPEIQWDRPGPWQGVSITHEIKGQRHTWKIPWDGVVTQAMAADILNVSLMSVNNWVRSGALSAIKPPGQPSVIPLRDIKSVRDVLHKYRRLRRDALGS